MLLLSMIFEPGVSFTYSPVSRSCISYNVFNCPIFCQ